MYHILLKSKIHYATITGASIDYVGSITIGKSLIEAAGLRLHEKVLVANITNGNRFETYVIEGDDQVIEVNGAATKLAQKGDKVIIMAFGLYDEWEAKQHKPKIIVVDDENSITSQLP